MHSCRVARATVFLCAAALPAAAQQPAPLGGEIQVSAPTGSAGDPAVAADAAGNFVVVWVSGLDGSSSGVFARRYDATGSPLGLEFQVNTYTTGLQTDPAVAMNAAGEWVVVWQSWDGQDGSDIGVFGQRYDADGNPAGAEFVVSVATFQAQRYPSVGMAGDGSFVVAWDGDTQAGAYRAIHGRRFDGSGNPLGGDFFVTWYIGDTALAMNDAGEFVVATNQRARRFDAAGDALGPDFPLEPGPYSAGSVAVAMDADGAFVATWHRDVGTAADVVARSFDPSGTPTAVFPVNAYTTGQQRFASVAMLPGGGFVVVWRDTPNFSADTDTFGQRFDAAGTPAGSEFRVNAYTTGSQWDAVLAATAADRFVVAWVNQPTVSGTPRSIVARLWTAPPDLIFAGGFESGDLGAWSAAQTDGGDLSVSGAAAMASTFLGLRADVDDQASLYVQDDSPSGETRYRARFYLDPASFDPGRAHGHLRTRVFLAFADAPLKRLVQVVLRRIGDQYSLGAHVRRDNDTLAETGFTGITAAPHAVEIDWRRATRAGTNDGGFEMWIDGTSVAALTGLDNDERAVDFVRLGALSVKAGASGTLSFDEFESRRATYIGP